MATGRRTEAILRSDVLPFLQQLIKRVRNLEVQSRYLVLWVIKRRRRRRSHLLRDRNALLSQYQSVSHTVCLCLRLKAKVKWKYCISGPTYIAYIHFLSLEWSTSIKCKYQYNSRTHGAVVAVNVMIPEDTDLEILIRIRRYSSTRSLRIIEMNEWHVKGLVFSRFHLMVILVVQHGQL